MIKKISLTLLLLILILVYQLYLNDIIRNIGSDSIISTVINIIWAITILSVIAVLILENHSPSKTLSWIIILVFFPILGFIFYLFIGRNFRKLKIYTAKERKDYEELTQLSQREQNLLLNMSLSDSMGTEERMIANLFENNNKAFLTNFNRLQIFSDGNSAIESIFDEIEKARNNIHIQFFVIKNDVVGNKLKDILIRKAKEGISIRLLYDSVGSWRLSANFLNSLKQAGVKTASFSPVNIPFINSKLNYRNHRKIVVIDGETAFTGGVNIADKYCSKDPNIGYWRDTHLKIRGEAVHSLQALFITDWLFATKEKMTTENYFSPSDCNLYNPLQIVSSGPDSNWESIMQGYFAMISFAKHHINIVTPYLILNESMMTAVKVAALSGVEVRIIVPAKTDHLIVYWAAKSYYQELLQAGIKIFEYQKGFIHSKIITIDGKVSSIGSANMDIRSFTQNFEVNAFIYSQEVTSQINAIFEDDLKVSKQLLLENFLKRPLTRKIAESTARIFSPLL